MKRKYLDMHISQQPCLQTFRLKKNKSKQLLLKKLTLNVLMIVPVILDTGVELELDDCMPFLEWLANNYKQFGATLEIITDRSQEGSQV